jgi:hypothetical protein
LTSRLIRQPVDERRLADAGFAIDQDEAAASCQRLPEMLAQQILLALPANQRGRLPARRPGVLRGMDHGVPRGRLSDG